MADQRDQEMFEADRDWLSQQPGMNSWPQGCDGLTTTLSEWVADYSEPLCEEMVTPSDASFRKYVTRLWMCWSHHWQQGRQEAGGTIDGASVAARIQLGRGYTGGGKLGGNPLRDVVLAVAMVAKEDRAAERFLTEYAESCRRVGSRIHSDADDWWDEFVDRLAGYSGGKSKPVLDSFSGRCGLMHWLGRTVVRFVTRRRQSLRSVGGCSVESLDEHSSEMADTGSFDTAAKREGKAIILKALTQVPAADRLLILAVFIDRTKKTAIAGQLGLHPGQITRRMKRALERLREALNECAADEPGGSPLNELIGHQGGSQYDFGRTLVEALEASIPDDSRGIRNDDKTNTPKSGETDQ